MKPTSHPKQPHSRIQLAALIAVGTLGWSNTLVAQDNSEEEVFTLSPFNVEANDSVGYQATSTLAGTRIKSDLKDVASSIQVATKEFIEDTGSTDFEDLLVYTTSTEVAGLGGNYGGVRDGGGAGSFNLDAAAYNPQGSTRVRGLSQADLTMDYFGTNILTDTYNTQSVTISRGPNAALFGLGSPGGIIDTALKRAQFAEDFNELEFRVDNWGTLRSAFDVNRVLIDSKLALRLNGLWEDEKYEQDVAFSEDKRLYADIEYKPTDTTILRLNAETGSIDANRPVLTPPGDMTTYWWSVFDQAPFNPGVDNFRQIPGLWPGFSNIANRSFAMIYDAQNGGQLQEITGLTPHPRNIDFAEPGRPPVDGHLGHLRANNEVRFLNGLLPNATSGTVPLWEPTKITDRSIFDYRTQSTVGDNKWENEDFTRYNLSLSQTFLENNLGFEIAYNNEAFERHYSRMIPSYEANAIWVDINQTLSDGRPNPNYGRPYVSHGGWGFVNNDEREDFRISGFGRLDFTKRDGILNHFGNHILTGLFTSSSADSSSRDGRLGNVNQEYNDNRGIDHPLGNHPRTLASNIIYIGDSLANASTPVGANIPGLTGSHNQSVSSNSLLWDREAGEYQLKTISVQRWEDDPSSNFTNGSNFASEVDSIVGVLQSFFLQRNLVTTVSWRKDEVEQFEDTNVERNANGYILPDYTPDLSTPALSESVDAWSYGVVGHVPTNWLPEGTGFSVHYNESSNFNPDGAARNIYGEVLGNPSGETEEYGFTFNLLNNKLSARVNFYETSQVGTRIGVPWGPHLLYSDRVYEFNSQAELDAAGWNLPDQRILDAVQWRQEGTHPNGNPNYEYTTTGINSTRDFISEGTEIEIAFNPIRNWRIHFNAAQAEAVTNNSAPLFAQYVADNATYWDRPEISALWAQPRENPGAATWGLGVAGTRSALALAKNNDGGPSNQLREWRWNLITNYQFTDDSKLKGVGVGTSLRWQDEMAAGFPLVDDPELGLVPDVRNPFYGDSELNVDAWVNYSRKLRNDTIEWKIGLRARNLTSGEDLIVISHDPDGMPVDFRIAAATTWELSNTFSF